MKVILLGSGGLSIGQAGEFDYSGTQAVKALLAEKIEVIVVNPNIATVQTDPSLATKVYLYPVEPEWVEKIIELEKPDGVIAGFGGQTALNCVMQLDAQGVLKKHGVKNLGTSIESLRITEDRDLFAKHMKSIDMPIPASKAVSTLQEALQVAREIGFPVIVRAAYALGGLGSGFAKNDEELRALLEIALSNSPQVLVEKSLQGWKELEYEVMRDSFGNRIIVCNMENLDPLGIHTGDSIVVAPSQTLNNDEYQLLRDAALKIVDSLKIVGECNVQFALNPRSQEFFVIEVNARLSRSSALASKATGYPIASIAAQVVLSRSLLELKNPVTGETCALFEPALDYITVKIPRWDMAKFRGVSRKLGSAMKSVGEVMAIARTFSETLQKAVRMVTEHGEGLSHPWELDSGVSVAELLRDATDQRLFALMLALRQGRSIDELHDLTHIDPWFLSELAQIVEVEKEILQNTKKKPIEKTLQSIEAKTWLRWKRFGFGDEQIAGLVLRAQSPDGERVRASAIQQCSLLVRQAREHCGIKPVVKKIDTTAGEHPTPSNYLYCTYVASESDVKPRPHKPSGHGKTALVLGGGAYRVGTSVEFDWCAVRACQRLRHHHWSSIMINCNPETVSTDYNSSDRLYFEELTLERILDIAALENPEGVFVSMGGQQPNKLALPLAQAGLRLLGHSPETVDRAEDRSQFSTLLDNLKIEQPRWVKSSSKKEIDTFTNATGFPVLVRPSYVLSGAAMTVAYDKESLERALSQAEDISADHPIVISDFVEGAREIELDGVAKDGEILISIMSEHVENAGVHSGDATMVVPAQKIYVETARRVRRAGRLIARELKLNGPFNIQFLAQFNQIKVIECNARASRSFPFVSKISGRNLIDLAVDIVVKSEKEFLPKDHQINEDEFPHVGVKAAMFSFGRLVGADPVLGVEMASTGEVGCLGRVFEDALLLALQSTGVKVPKKGVLISAGPEREKLKFLSAMTVLQKMKIPLYATEGTAVYLKSHGYNVQAVSWPGEGTHDVLELIRSGEVDFVINIPKNLQKRELTHGAQIRQTAVRHGCSLLTNIEKVTAYIKALGRYRNFLHSHELIALPKIENL